MNKISVIIKREYMTRVRKKSFIIMTILAPLLMAGLIVASIFLTMNKDREFKKIAVIEDGSDLFKNVDLDSEDADYVYLEDVKYSDLKNNFEQAGYYGILYISPEIINTPNAVELITRKTPPVFVIEDVSSKLEKEIERQKLLTYNIQNLDEIMKDIKTDVSVKTTLIDAEGKATETSSLIAAILAYIGGFMMYMLVFMFGAQVMRGVIEEKTSRVVEVVVSSVKPIQLMMGKIIGIALVGLTQFLIWVVLTAVTVGVVQATVLKKKDITEITRNLPQNVMAEDQLVASPTQSGGVPAEFSDFEKIFTNIKNQNWLLIITAFIFYFITGYLLYASIFAAIGSAVDNETETQQFMLPVTIPIIFALLVAMATMQNPESSVSFWFSIIPLTSPIVMVARIPFAPPAWQIAVSMVLMVLTFMVFVWMAAKIYRTGILMYGKKASWKEMWKWLRYSG